MKRRFRSPSLFWTFAGSFLVVLVVATILQVLVVATIIEPIASQWMENRAALSAEQAAEEIGAALRVSPDADIRSILRSYRSQARAVELVFRGIDGRMISGRRISPQMNRRLRSFLESRGDTLGRWSYARRRWRDLIGEDKDRLLPGSRDTADMRDFSRFARRPVGRDRLHPTISRYPVILESGVVGHVLAIIPPRRFSLWPRQTPWPILLTVPIAVLLAGGAGMVMFRLFLRRLRRLDDLAARVTEGDLDARIPDPGADEIGQLGARLNRMTESLAEAKRRIDESDRQRRQLLADISHELATPLTSIRGYTETLLEPSVAVSDEERAEYLRDVLQEAKRMDLLIQDLLDLTRLEAGAISMEKERLDWTALCRNTMDRFKTRFDEAGLNIQWSGPAKSAWISADGRRLEQVLENLLTNAIRYVQAGGTVLLSVEPIHEMAAGGYRLTVADDGPGFPPEDLPHVFDRFYRADAARAAGGTGLGLAIVQEIVRRHGGEVRAENRSPVGAAIIIELPVSDVRT